MRRLAPSRPATSILTIGVLLAVLSGCDLLSGAAGDQGRDGRPPGGLEKTSIELGILPVVDAASAAIAQAERYFRAEGLQVELVPMPAEGAAVPGLVNGELDATFGNYVSFIAAQYQQVGDFRLISDGYQATECTFVIVAKPDSGIRLPLDLAGKRIAVNTFNNIVELTARSALQTNGVDPNSVEFVELGFPDMIPALQNNQIDAAVLVEPFITEAQRSLGVRPVLDAASGPTAEIPIAGYAVTREFAEQNPTTVAALQRALAKGLRDARERRTVENILPSYTEIDEQTAALIPIGTFPTSLDATRLQRIADLMSQFGVLNQPFDVAPMIQPPAGG
ncbi:MAG: ABC transporter substrate-binding protein [Pseudonocardiaceae bacterium]